MPDLSPNTDIGEHAHCWECRRRRLVCDGTQPVCKKCRAAGIVCPGYADKKPLTWLAPGQVMSRRRRKRTTRQETKPCTLKRCEKPKPEPGMDPSQVPSDTTKAVSFPAAIRHEIYDLYDAVAYYNAHIYPNLVRTQFGPNRFEVPLEMVDDVSLPLIHMVVSAVISHRIIQMAECPASDQLVKPLWGRLYHHRDIAVREVRKLLASEAGRRNIETVTAVYTLLYTMLQQSFTPCWRIHVSGFLGLMQLHGSLADLVHSFPDMELSLVALCIVGALANTTSPRDNQIRVASTADTLRLLETYYTETYFPSVTCPPALLTELIHINHLRAQPPGPATAASAAALLARIDAFSPEAWSASKDPHDRHDWLLVSAAFHAAVALYAVLALQSSRALPRASPALDLARARHARRLLALLERAAAAPRARRRMTWPLVVAGVEAARAGREVQRYIADQLAERGREHGAAPPIVARRVLEAFWASAGREWDECFREPLCLVL